MTYKYLLFTLLALICKALIKKILLLRMTCKEGQQHRNVCFFGSLTSLGINKTQNKNKKLQN